MSSNCVQRFLCVCVCKLMYGITLLWLFWKYFTGLCQRFEHVTVHGRPVVHCDTAEHGRREPAAALNVSPLPRLRAVVLKMSHNEGRRAHSSARTCTAKASERSALSLGASRTAAAISFQASSRSSL